MDIGRLIRQRDPGRDVDPGTFWLLKNIAAQRLHAGHGHRCSTPTSTRPRCPGTSPSCSKAGLIDRTPDPDDRRAQLVELDRDRPQKLTGRPAVADDAAGAQLGDAGALKTWSSWTGDAPPIRHRRRDLTENLETMTKYVASSHREDGAAPGRRSRHRSTGASPPERGRSGRRLPEPQADPGGDGRPDGRDVPRRPRPEHRRGRPAQDHLRIWAAWASCPGWSRPTCSPRPRPHRCGARSPTSTAGGPCSRRRSSSS